MTLNPDWQISPCHGLGPLRLGMSARQVGTFDVTFGAVTRRIDDNQAAEAVIKTLEPFADTVPAIRENIARMRAQASGVVTEHRALDAPILKYRHDQLVEILVPADCDQTHLAGQPVFGSDSRAAIAHLASVAGELRFLSPEVMAASLCLLLLEFGVAAHDRRVIFSKVGPRQEDHRIVKIVTREEIQGKLNDYRILEGKEYTL